MQIITSATFPFQLGLTWQVIKQSVNDPLSLWFYLCPQAEQRNLKLNYVFCL